MRIKKYTGDNEKEAMIKVKDELGKEALIVSVKRVKPKGIYKLFRKPYVEVTAAVDEKSAMDTVMKEPLKEEPFVKSTIDLKAETSNQVDDASFIQLLRDLARKDLEKNGNLYNGKGNMEGTPPKVIAEEPTNHEPYLTMVYEQLLENEVDEKIINELMVGLEEMAASKDNELDGIIATLYKRIVKKLSDVEPIQLEFDRNNVAVFVGPTGVGKTTTIAKIASYFTLNLGKKVALVTADTYRIAAVEQLRTYANILNIPIKVVYNVSEMKQALNQFKDIDLILVDTAGRSHKHEEHQGELIELLDSIPQKEVFLVLSMATKYNDLRKICEVYASVKSFKLIFTKLDETSSFGNIINVKEKTNAKLSYVTFGQNVPDDISEFDTHDIAKKTLGGCDL